MSACSIQSAYEFARNHWVGCDWPFLYGPLRLRLTGLNSRQAGVIAEATAGFESKQWRAASAWLLQVELDAEAATRAGSRAWNAARCNDLKEARRHAAFAYSLESKYRSDTVWGELLKAIDGQLQQQLATKSPK